LPEIKAVLASNLYGQNQTVESAISRTAEAKTKVRINNLLDNESHLKLKELTLLAIISELKKTENENSSLYDYLVVDLMRQLDSFNMARFYQGTTCLSEKSDFFPKGFPFKLRQRAESVLIAKLKDAIGPKEVLDYLVAVQRKKKIRQLEKDFTYAAKQEVDGSRYAKLMFEIGRLLVAPTNNEFFFKKGIVNTLRSGEGVSLIHIKCLRFVYPYGRELKVLPDLEDVVIPTMVKGCYFKPRGEHEFPARVLKLVKLFQNYGIKVKLTILLAAEDLEILYPKESLLIGRENKKIAFFQANQYLSCLKRELSFVSETLTLKTFLKNKGIYSYYKETRKRCLIDIHRAQGHFLRDKTFEKKVNTQFERYSRIFGARYSRSEARRSAAE